MLRISRFWKWTYILSDDAEDYNQNDFPDVNQINDQD